jgi:hypothetical protein
MYLKKISKKKDLVIKKNHFTFDKGLNSLALQKFQNDFKCY